jgi:predicted unusual protein kinase regulating ubiquinone biosynthesis (AarF/ABC1/UbiB family)
VFNLNRILATLFVFISTTLVLTKKLKNYPKEPFVKHGRLWRLLQPLKAIRKVFFKRIIYRLKYFFYRDKENLQHEFAFRSAQEVSQTLGQMKGALMKLGQLASFIDNTLPDNAKEALATLQKSAPPMVKELTFEVFKDSFGRYPDEVFKVFKSDPLAAASIGQVHFALTKKGDPVAVKIQYPNIKESIIADLNNLNLISIIKPFLWKGLDLEALMAELKERLLEEVDYLIEAKNQMTFYEFYKHHPFIKIPLVYSDYSTDKILTTEFISGKSFYEIKAASQNERNLAAEAIYRFAFRSIYHMLAFNGDPHPGNYLFHSKGVVTFLDFGLVKHFTVDDIAQTFEIIRYGALTPDKAKLRQAIENCGFIKKQAPVNDEELYDFSEIFLALVKQDCDFTIDPRWASEVSRRVLFGYTSHKNVINYANLPANYAILQRINLGLLAVMGQLNATANWRKISEEIWPEIQGPPSSYLGHLEKKWLEDKAKREPLHL